MPPCLETGLDHEADHACPVYGRVICADLCYESLCALGRVIKISSVPELAEIGDIEEARRLCAACPYSDLS